MHSVVNGCARDVLDIDASAPHQQACVSMALTDSILVMAERYGSGRLSTERADQFVREQSTHGALLDPRVDLDAIFRDPARRAAPPAGELPLPLNAERSLPTTRSRLQHPPREGKPGRAAGRESMCQPASPTGVA